MVAGLTFILITPTVCGDEFKEQFGPGSRCPLIVNHGEFHLFRHQIRWLALMLDRVPAAVEVRRMLEQCFDEHADGGVNQLVH